MASWNENEFGGCKSYLDDPCPYCGGPHFWKDCRNAPGREVCAPSQSYREYDCYLCGGRDGHWSDCPNYCAPSSSYDNENASCSFEFDRNHDVAKEEQCARHKGIEAILQTIFERVTNVGGDIYLLHKSMVAFGKECEKEEDPCEDANVSCFIDLSNP